MSLLKRAARAQTEQRAEFGSSAIPPPTSIFSMGGTGYPVSSEGAMKHPAVYACSRIISDTVSSFCVDAYSGDPGLHLGAAARISPKPQILAKPSAYLSGVQWIHQVMMSLLLQGNAYGLISASDRLGYPTQIELIDPQSVNVQRATGNEVNAMSGRRIASGTKVFKIHGKTLTSNEVWHCPGPSLPGELAGLSPVKMAARVIGMGLEAEQFGLDFFQNGIHPTAVASTDQPIDEKTAATVKDRIKRAVANRDVPVLGAGLNLSPWSVTPQDSMLLEVMRANEVMVCMIFGVPPEMLGEGSKGSTITYANREQRAQDFLNTAINPWLVRLEDSFSGLFPRTTFVKFDTKNLLKSDLLTRYQAWQTGLAAQFLTVDEVREFEDLPELPEPPAPPTTDPGNADPGMPEDPTND